MAMVEGAKYERKYLAHFIDENFGATPSYKRLGKDLEEYNIELNPDVETKQNILGESTTNVKGYSPQGTIDTYYAYKGDALFEHLFDIVNERATGSKLETTVVDVLLDSDGTVVSAYKENVTVVPSSVGGGTDGVMIPFDIYYVGERVAGSFDVSTRKFTPTTNS